jgi:hypothetical protein
MEGAENEQHRLLHIEGASSDLFWFCLGGNDRGPNPLRLRREPFLQLRRTRGNQWLH